MAIDPREIVNKFKPRQSRAPICMCLRGESFRAVKKSNRDIQLVLESVVRVANRRTAVGAKRSSHALGLRKRLRHSMNQIEIAGSIPNPNVQWTSNRPTAIVIMVIANPEGLTAQFGCDRAAKTGAGFKSRAHFLILARKFVRKDAEADRSTPLKHYYLLCHYRQISPGITRWKSRLYTVVRFQPGSPPKIARG
jgi:hypothetical protein